MLGPAPQQRLHPNHPVSQAVEKWPEGPISAEQRSLPDALSIIYKMERAGRVTATEGKLKLKCVLHIMLWKTRELFFFPGKTIFFSCKMVELGFINSQWWCGCYLLLNTIFLAHLRFQVPGRWSKYSIAILFERDLLLFLHMPGSPDSHHVISSKRSEIAPLSFVQPFIWRCSTDNFLYPEPLGIWLQIITQMGMWLLYSLSSVLYPKCGIAVP